MIIEPIPLQIIGVLATDLLNISLMISSPLNINIPIIAIKEIYHTFDDMKKTTLQW